MKLKKNTYIADTPGFSSFEINEIESSELDKYFIEIEKELGNCEFVGCTHIKKKKMWSETSCTRWKNISR